MGVASLVLGIISIIVGFVPFCGIIALFPAVLGFILGLVDTVLKSKRKEPRGISIAGLIVSIIAVIVILVYFFITSIGLVAYSDILNTATNSFSYYNDLVSSEETTVNSIYESTDSSLNYTCHVGESATADNMKVTFTSIDKDFKDYSSYASVSDGYKVIKADFGFENVGTSSNYASSYDFDCYADDVVCSKFYYATNSSFSSSLESGKKANGSIYFEVPKDTKKIEIVYDGNTWKDGKITFVID